MEVRKMMRYDTHAGRIRRGASIFVTWSPDEKHNTLMVRLHRSRINDPMNELDPVSKKFGSRFLPSMDADYVEMNIGVDKIIDWLPKYDDRRALLARDALASVDGFRLSILLTCEYIFGLRVCACCPHCNHHDKRSYMDCCQDLMGTIPFRMVALVAVQTVLQYQ